MTAQPRCEIGWGLVTHAAYVKPLRPLCGAQCGRTTPRLARIPKPVPRTKPITCGNCKRIMAARERGA
jgi:hypothetical protein